MNCKFHEGRKATQEAKPINLTFWTPICRPCGDEFGGTWVRRPLRATARSQCTVEPEPRNK